MMSNSWGLSEAIGKLSSQRSHSHTAGCDIATVPGRVLHFDTILYYLYTLCAIKDTYTKQMQKGCSGYAIDAQNCSD